MSYLSASEVMIHYEEALYQVIQVYIFNLTGCAVAQHCYTATSCFPMGNMETLTPCKIETLEQIDTQFVRIDYDHERNVCSKFG